MNIDKALRHAGLAAALVCALAAVPASAGASATARADASAEATLSSEAPSLSVLDPGREASELLGRLTIPQLASLLHVTPAQLAELLRNSCGGLLDETLAALLANPTTSLQEVLNLLVRTGVGAATAEQAIAPLVARATGHAQQLISVVASAIADLSEDGALAELASELALPPAAIEAAKLAAGSAAQVAEVLGTSASRLSSALMAAGALEQPLADAAPVVVAPVDRAASTGTTLLVGTPTGTGGITLTTINSTSPAGNAGGVAGFKSTAHGGVSNAFSILSLKVTRTGAIIEKVRLPGPGRLRVIATATKTPARKSATKRHLRGRRVKVASAALRSSGGTLTITLHPHGVNRKGRTRVTLATMFAPTGGSPRTLTRSVTIGRRGSRRHRSMTGAHQNRSARSSPERAV